MNGRVWTEKELSYLGKMTDSEVGEILGRTKNCVMKMRQSLGIAPFTKYIDWDSKRAKRLISSNKSAIEVADLLGTTRNTIHKKRRLLNS